MLMEERKRMLYQNDKKIEKLYSFFIYGYKPKDIAELLNIPLSIVDEAYKRWINLKKKVGREV